MTTTMPRSPIALSIILSAVVAIFVPGGQRTACAAPSGRMVSMQGADCSGDFDGDLIVDGTDLFQLLTAWGGCVENDCIEDIDGDGLVGGQDLMVLLSVWGPISEDCAGGPTLATTSGALATHGSSSGRTTGSCCGGGVQAGSDASPIGDSGSTGGGGRTGEVALGSSGTDSAFSGGCYLNASPRSSGGTRTAGLGGYRGSGG